MKYSHFFKIIEIGQMVLVQGQWYIVDSIEGFDIFLSDDNGTEKLVKYNQIEFTN